MASYALSQSHKDVRSPALTAYRVFTLMCHS